MIGSKQDVGKLPGGCSVARASDTASQYGLGLDILTLSNPSRQVGCLLHRYGNLAPQGKQNFPYGTCHDMARWAVQLGVTTQGMGQMIRGNTPSMGGKGSLEVVGGLVC